MTNKNEPDKPLINKNGSLAILNAIKNIIIIIDPEHRIIDFNVEAESLYGVSKDDVIGKNYLELFVPPEVRDFVAKDIKKVLNGNPTVSFENDILTHGKTRTINWSVNRLATDDDRAIGVIASGLDVTSRKATENKLRDSEKRFRAISRVLGHGVYVLDRDKKLMFINDEGERILGWKKEELIGKKPHGLFHYKKLDGSPYPEEECPVIQVIDSGQSYESQNEAFVKKDGTIIPIAYTATPLIEDGRVNGSVNIFEDISERKSNQQKIIKEREFTTTLLKGLSDGFVALDKDGKIVFANDALCQLTGYSENEIVGTTAPYKFWPKEEYKNINEVLQKVLNGIEGEFELTLKRKNGERFTALTSPRKTTDPDGNPLFFTTIQDVTDQKRARERIEKERQLTASLIQGLSEGFTVLDSEGRLISANKAFEKLTGFTEEELQGSKPPFKYWAEEDYPAIYESFKKTIQGETGEYELMFKKKDGQKFVALINPRMTTDPDGKTIFFATIKDISQRKRNQQIIEREKEFTASLIQGLTEGLAVVDENSTLILANDALVEMTGFSRDELEGTKMPFKYWPEESLEQLSDIFKRTRAGEKGEWEVAFRKKSGERFISLISPRKAIDPDGNLIFFSTIKDITDRKKAELDLARFKFIIDNTTEEFFLLKPDGHVAYTNKAAIESLGYSEEEIYDLKVPDFDPIYEKEVFKKHFLELKAGDLPAFETIHITKTGQKISKEMKSVYLKIGNEEYICAFGRDITERKKAEEELKRYKFFLENAGEDFYLVRPDGSLDYVNRTTANSLGYSTEELLSMKVGDFDPIFNKEKMRQHFEEIKTRDLPPFETIQIAKDGKKLYKEIKTVYIAIGNEEFACAFGRDISERKKTEKALRESEEKFRAVIEQSTDGISMGTPDGKVVIYNQAMESISGYSIEEVNQYGWFNLAYPDETERKLGLKLAQEAIKGKVRYAEGRITRKDGEKRWVAFKLTPMSYGGQTYNLGIASDIEERKRSEQQLKENEEKYRKLIELANDAIFIADAQTGILIDANKKATEMLGAPVSEIIGMHQSKLHPPEEAERYRQIFTNAVQTGSIISEELYVIRKDGSRVPVEISANITEVAGRQIAQGIFRDITERKAAEERLRLFSSAVEAAADGIQLTDLEGNLIYSNKSIEKIFGYAPGEERFVGEMNVDPDLIGNKIIPEIRSKGHWAGELIARHSDGHTFPIFLSSSVVTDNQNNPIALLGVLRDITRQKQMEHKQKRGREFSEALNEMTAAMNSTLNINLILQQVVAKARKAIGSESAGIALREESSWHIKYSCKLPPGLTDRFLSDSQAKLALLATQSRQAMISNDSYNDPRVDAKLMKENQIRSFMAVPLMIRDEVLGMIYFFNHSEPAVFDNAQLEFANRLATSVSLSIENARLYQAERNIADTLQKSILTVPKSVPGIEFDYLYRSATETAMVGGDFYDIFEIEHGKIGIIIGDVSGKGLNAATLTSLIKNTLKAYSYDNQNISDILSKTNNVITGNSAASVFATVFVGIIDTKTGALTYSNAGHPPPIIKTTGSSGGGPTTRFLKNGNTAIGVFLDQNYDEKTVHLDKGDMLLLYTDGVIEARRGKELFTEERLFDLMSALKIDDIKGIPGKIYDEIDRFAKGTLVDDIAILSLSLK